MRYGSVFLFGVAAAGLGLAPQIRAATITQDPTKTYVAFEAETNATLTSPSTAAFGSASDATASGGAALLASGIRDDANKATATYTIKFTAAGTYLLYDLCRSDQSLVPTDQFSANSFYVPTAFGAEPATTAAYNGSSNSATYLAFVETPTFTVAAGDLVTFKIAARESGTYIDRFAFVSSSTPLWDGTATDAQKLAAFGALSNSSVPEPASLASLAVATGLLLRRRRHGA